MSEITSGNTGSGFYSTLPKVFAAFLVGIGIAVFMVVVFKGLGYL